MVLKVNGGKAGGLQPLFVLVNSKGDTSYVTSAEHLDPNEIDSITVLKGAAAITKYGKDGENGVVIITTQKLIVRSHKRYINDLPNPRNPLGLWGLPF